MPNFYFSNTFSGLVSFVAIGGAIALSFDCTLAQITPDGTLGTESSVVTTNVNINGLPSDRIDGGAIRGANVFHSFKEFNINEGRGAYFTNPDGIQNILSRVTGNDPSNILGRLGVLGNANLFFINPNGIIFGPNARLDVGGSFLASTASSLNFADGTQFSATAPQNTPLLTISVPIGLQYGENPGRILVQGDGQGARTTSELIDTTVGLRVQPNQTLALVGGDVALEGGTLKTAGGRIELGSVAGPGLVSLTPTDKGWTLGYEGVPTFGNIQLSQQATADASGMGGGDVQVFGRRLSLTNGSQVEASTLEKEPGGTLSITTSDSVELIGESADGQFSSVLATSVYPGATGDGGNLTIGTGQLIVRGGAQIFANTYGIGNAGSLAVRASDSVEVIGTTADGFIPSALFTSVAPGATGDGGNLTIGTGQLIVRDGAQIFAGTLGKGKAGNLTVRAAESVELIGTLATFSRLGSALATLVDLGATGDGGSLTIETGRLTIRDGAVVSSATFSSGAAGTLAITASELVELIGTSTDGRYSSRLTARTTSSGAAGNLTIDTGQLSVRDGAEVNVSSTGSGNAGNLQLIARDFLLDKQAALSSETTSGQGNILLRSQNLVLRHSSNITTNATGTTNGGNITIDTGVIAALENSDITANAVQGRGGNIEINTQGIFGTEPRSELTPQSDITASSRLGINGTVQINSLEIDPSSATFQPVALPEIPEVADVCQRGSATNEFYITGTGGIPQSPSDPLTSMDGWHDTSYPAQSPQNTQSPERSSVTFDDSYPGELPENSELPEYSRASEPPTEIVEAQGWIQTPDGTIILTAEAHGVVPYSSWSNPSCQQASSPKERP